MNAGRDPVPRLPHNPDAERAVLGAILLDTGALKTASEQLTPSDFFLPEHRAIFTRMLALATAGVAVDLVTLTDALAQRGEIERAGGAAYVASLVDGVPRVSNVDHYCAIIAGKAELRRFARAGEEIFQAALKEGASPDAVRAQAHRLLPAQQRSRSTVLSAWEDIPRVSDIPASRVEWCCDGLAPRGSIVLLAGEPGAYKTWLALCLAKAASEGGEFLARPCAQMEVLYLDRENPAALVRDRAALLGLENCENLRYWGGWLQDAPPGIGDVRLLEIARTRKSLMIFDSLVRFHSADENSASEMARVMGDLRALANGGATVVALHHKSKSQGSTYRGSSDIAAGADVCIAVLKDPASGLLTLRVFKNRFGAEHSLTVCPELGRAGDFIVTDAPAVSAEREDAARLAEVITAAPGLSQSEVIKRSGLPERKAGQILRGNAGGLWRTGAGPHRATLYYPVGETAEVTI